jgi:hypothetical protein
MFVSIEKATKEDAQEIFDIQVKASLPLIREIQRL